jgi:hypothetical protein
MQKSIDAKWIKGVNSLLDSSLLGDGEYQWAQNIDNAGGIISTRQGFNAIGVKNGRLPSLEPKGIASFVDKNGKVSLVIAIGDKIYASFLPFDQFTLIGDGFVSDDSVVFCRAFVSVKLNSDTSITVIDPYPILVMQNGSEKPKYWDGASLQTADPSATQPEIPIGKWMQWSGSRLWVASRNLLHASDLGNPIKFFEETEIAGGGALFFEDVITGMNQTYSLETLLVCTDFNTSIVESTIYDRTQWALTPGFQKVFLPGIGCAAGKSFTRQWGVVWWYSHGGLVQLDQAIQTYRTSRIRFRDQEMMRGKSNLADDISGICTGSFGNYMLVSVPSGDKYNAHNWLINQRVVDIGVDPYYGDPSEWAANWTGIKPVEYCSAVINGQQRLFCLSRDAGDTVNQFYPTVWELFTGERQDRYNDTVSHPPCTLETKLLGMSDDLKTFYHAEIDVAELSAMANIKVYAASRRGGYHLILDQDLTASEGSVNSNATAQYVSKTTQSFDLNTDTILRVDSASGSLASPSTINIGGKVLSYSSKTSTSFTISSSGSDIIPPGSQVTQPQFSYPNPDTIVTNFIPQRRILKTNRWDAQTTDCQSCPVESNFTDNVDRGFSLFIEWTGKLSITGLRIFWEPYPDQEQGPSKVQADELYAQYLTDAGCGNVTSVLESPTVDTARLRSQYLRIVTPKKNDVTYYSPVPPL